MNVTLREIITAREALTNLGNQKLPIKIGYSVSKVIKFANKELRDFAEVRDSIVEVPEGEEMTPELSEDINQQINQALDVEKEIPVYKIDLSNLSSVELSTKDIIALEPFCIFETSELGMG